MLSKACRIDLQSLAFHTKFAASSAGSEDAVWAALLCASTSSPLSTLVLLLFVLCQECKIYPRAESLVQVNFGSFCPCCPGGRDNIGCFQKMLWSRKLLDKKQESKLFLCSFRAQMGSYSPCYKIPNCNTLGIWNWTIFRLRGIFLKYRANPKSASVPAVKVWGGESVTARAVLHGQT